MLADTSPDKTTEQMKLYYYQDPRGNFGDDLNQWLWPKLIPHLLDDDENELFVGIGTLLNEKLPVTPTKHVFGSGVGYGVAPALTDRFNIHAVRGPLSAKALNLPADKAITDAAVLIRMFKPVATPKKHAVGLVPAGHSLDQFGWEQVCETSGIAFISCHWNVDRFLAALMDCELVLCEAMHGAIVADALRIPWIPVSLYGETLGFKWDDWLSTLNLSYKPLRIPPLHSDDQLSLYERLKVSTKRTLRSAGVYASTWSPPPPAPSTRKEIDKALDELHRVSRTAPYLSDEHLLDKHMERYLRLLERLKPSERYSATS